MNNSLSRRRFLSHGISGLSSAWITAHWPAVLSAADHARRAAQSATPPKFEFFSPEQAAEIDAIAARIIPTDGTPGAREAGVVYFIDRALTTFASDDQKTYKEGLPELQARVRELFPAVERFSAATPEQQDEVLHSLDDHAPVPARPFRPRPAAIPDVAVPDGRRRRPGGKADTRDVGLSARQLLDRAHAVAGGELR